MGRYHIPADAWRQATLALLRYPETERELQEAVEESRTRIPGKGEGGAKPSHSNPTEAAALRLYDDARYQRLKREAKAVEEATANLDQIELDVIRKRFWDHRAGHRRVRGYDNIQDTGYSRRKMQEIVRRVIIATAAALGEI